MQNYFQFTVFSIVEVNSLQIVSHEQKYTLTKLEDHLKNEHLKIRTDSNTSNYIIQE